MAKPDTTAMLAEFDALVEINGRLMFAKANYNEGEAEAFGVRLLEFFNRHAIDLRAAITTERELAVSIPMPQLSAWIAALEGFDAADVPDTVKAREEMRALQDASPLAGQQIGDVARKALKDLRSLEYKRGHCIHQRAMGDRCMCVECIESRADKALTAAIAEPAHG